MKFFSVFLLLFLSACIVTSTDLDLLRQDVNYLMRDSEKTQNEINSLKEKTEVTVKEDSFHAVRESQADLNARISEISMGLQELRGRFEENRYSVENSLKGSASEIELLKAQIASLENQLKILKVKSGAVSEHIETPERPIEQPGAEEGVTDIEDKSKLAEAEIKKQEEVIKEKEVPDDKTIDYEAAYQTFKDKNFREARKMFESFIKDYPENDLTDNAHFWIAETYYRENDYESAILAYESLLKKFPDSEKTAGAFLKQGFSFIELGDKKTGRIILEKLIERFPDSKESEIAKKKLTEISKKK